MTSGGDGDAPLPAAAVLAALAGDDWARLLPHARAVLRDLDADEVTPQVALVRGMPTGKLAGGRGRSELIRLLAGEPAVWLPLRRRLAAASDLPEGLRQLVQVGTSPAAASASDGPRARSADDGLRAKLKEVRDERDRWRRRAEGETARADALQRRVDELTQLAAGHDAAATELREQLAAAAGDRERAVERERRRRDAELAGLQEELAALRRAAEERRQAPAAHAPPRATRPAPMSGRPAPDGRHDGSDTRFVPGRPSRLPSDVAPGTTEEASLLLHRGRWVIVDGYNVTLRHRPQLDLERQRSWLVQLLAALAARHGVRPLIVFDGELAGGGRRGAGVRDVQVRFTSAGISADDEIVLAVEGTDDPVVVVTDDRELASRVRAVGADVIGTMQLLGSAS